MKKIFFFVIILILPLKVYGFETNARSAILVDTDTNRVLYAKDAHYVQSVASISKIMTAIVAIENANLQKKVTVGDEILKAYGSGIYVKQGEKIKLEDLIYGLMLRSGNDAALVIAKAVAGDTSKFVDLMNKKAKEIGMDDTTFNNPSGLDEEKGNLSSAYDMALLMSYAMQNIDFKKITGTKKHTVKTNKNTYVWHNKNKLLNQYKYTTGGKTGYTKIAKRTLVTSASKDGLNLAVVTLNDGSDWADHKKLYEEAFSKYKTYTLLDKGDISILGEDYYQKNKLYIKKNLQYPLLEAETEAISLKYKLEKKRNFKSGDKVGKASLYIGDKEVNSVNIYVDKNKTKDQSFLSKIKSWFNDK